MTKNSRSSSSGQYGVSTKADVAAFKAASGRFVKQATASNSLAKKVIERVERPASGEKKKK